MMKHINGLDSTLITFLWKPLAFYKNMKQSPNILSPFIVIFLITFIPVIILQVIQGMNEFTIPILMNALTTWLITGVGFLLISWGMITLMYKLMKVQKSAKIVLSVLLYAMLAKGYLSMLLGLILQLKISSLPMENYYGYPIWFVSIFTYVIFIVFVGFGLKWAVPSTNKQFLITFITYILFILVLFIALIIVASMLISMLFQDIGEMLRELFRIFE